MTRIKSRDCIFISAAVIASICLIGIGSATAQLPMENKSNDGGSSIYFSKIYVDGFSANSNGFKLLLRTYERRMDTYFQPFLVDIDFILMDEGKIIYLNTLKQLSLFPEKQGASEITDQAHIALKDGKNYTALAKVYLYERGSPSYYLTAASSFTAKNDAVITEVYGDGIGASATIKSKSMVPLNATIIFTLIRDGRAVETKEITAPSIMWHDKEKTVNVLWDRKLDEGVYMVSAALRGNDLVVNYDKVFTVEKKEVVATEKPAGQSGKNVPGFTFVLAALTIIFMCLRRGLRHGS
jgi:hypothetical protein